ncbi:MAG TPA: hypothetical protein VIT64_15580 [Ilumatobacteraceae bacterium]
MNDPMIGDDRLRAAPPGRLGVVCHTRQPLRSGAVPGLALGLTVLGLTVLGACSDDGGSRSADRYCEDLAENAQLLNFDLVTLDDVDGLRERYGHFADSAPLAVEEQWRLLADLVDAAATVDLTSTESRAVVVEQAASTERAAIEIAEHAATTCGLTLLMGTPPPATTTTVPPPDTTPAPGTTSAPTPETVPPETVAPATVPTETVPPESATTVAPPAST